MRNVLGRRLAETTKSADRDDVVIDIVGLTKSFGAVDVLKGVDLRVRRGEVVSILGKSGGGKSTLLRCINMLETPSDGRITVAGRSTFDGPSSKLRQRDLVSLRRDVGMLFQSLNVFSHLSVVENIGLPLVRIAGASPRAASDTALEFLGKVGLRHKALAMPSELSGGQLQRVALARAMALNPVALLFDEPTSALDPESTLEVLDVMKEISADGTTMVVVTHEVRFALGVSDTVVFMDDGRIIESGPPRQILSTPTHERTRSFLADHLGDARPSA